MCAIVLDVVAILQDLLPLALAQIKAAQDYILIIYLE